MPVYSPLSTQAVVGGFRALLSSSYATRARTAVHAWLKRGDPQRELLLLDSGTSALTLALQASATKENRPVAIPAFGCYDIATAVDGAGVPFSFYDLDQTTLGPDFGSLRRALEAGSDRILVVHQYGIPVNLDAVFSLAREFDAQVIEDAAQGVGAEWRGKSLGFHGSYGILSFGRGKGLTGAGGGALLMNDERARTQARSLKESLRSPSVRLQTIVALLAQWALARRWTYWIPAALPFVGLGETPYKSPKPAHRASDISIGVLCHGIADAEVEAAKRRGNVNRISPRRSRRDAVLQALPGYLRFPHLLARPLCHSERRRARALGVVLTYPTALVDLPRFGDRAQRPIPECPGARLLSEKLVTVPVHGALRPRDVELVASWFADAEDLSEARKWHKG